MPRTLAAARCSIVAVLSQTPICPASLLTSVGKRKNYHCRMNQSFADRCQLVSKIAGSSSELAWRSGCSCGLRTKSPGNIDKVVKNRILICLRRFTEFHNVNNLWIEMSSLLLLSFEDKQKSDWIDWLECWQMSCCVVFILQNEINCF